MTKSPEKRNADKAQDELSEAQCSVEKEKSAVHLAPFEVQNSG